LDNPSWAFFFLTKTNIMRNLITKIISTGLIIATTMTASYAESPYFASGIKVGEVDQSSAIIWCRLTKEETAKFGLLPIFTEGLKDKDKDAINMPLEVVPGMEGEVRVLYWKVGKAVTELKTEWVKVKAENDFVHQFKIEDLNAHGKYEFAVEARKNSDAPVSSKMTGEFKTAPTKDQAPPIRFVVTTCQAVRSVDSGADGHLAYKQMLDFEPNFFVHTGDILYYDKAPLCKSIPQARAKWNIMFSYGHNKKLHRHVSSYFMKDDHDTLKNDCFQGQTYGDMTFDQGLAIFREQVPMGEKTYRTYRWGKDVQIWLTENRDFRSHNGMKDGPEKTILGEEQKAWLKKTIAESDATHKFIITPGPIVGPDKRGKADNHSNKAFFNEGQELRDFIKTQKNTYVICGDRHWQYCSKDPKTGVLEMGCGPINDQHKYGGAPKADPTIHKYFGKRGGFLGISVEDGKAKAEWFTTNDVDPSTGKPKVGHTERLGL
jgi:alkaline phosphatase D